MPDKLNSRSLNFVYNINFAPKRKKGGHIIDTHLDGIKVFDSKTNKGPTEFKAQHTPIVSLLYHFHKA
jgi:hypothetical protein